MICAHCGQENEDGARVCSFCGSPLSAAAGAGATVLAGPDADATVLAQPQADVTVLAQADATVLAPPDGAAPQNPQAAEALPVIGIPAMDNTYELRRLIGKGGMSRVYLAQHKRLHIDVAVKTVRKQQGQQFDFLAESEILKRLQHPMLPRILDIYEDARTIYIVEDFVRGKTLAEVLRDRRVIDETTGDSWMRALAGLLQYLHTQPSPIIYRDMKPANIMLQEDGTLKLIDFGIAREYKSASAGDTTYAGTQGYAAPEQFGTAQSDARTDIYGLGVTMYHLLTGKSPYEKPYRFVPARQLNPKLSQGIEYILNKCVQPDPENRYQSAAELIDDLDHRYRFDDAYRRCQRQKRGRRALLAVLAAASAALICGGVRQLGLEKSARYESLITQANAAAAADPAQAQALADEAQALDAARPESWRAHAYALYAGGDYAGCQAYAEQALGRFAEDGGLLQLLAAAQFEQDDYEGATENYAQAQAAGVLDAAGLRDYAVCLGRLGRLNEAKAVLAQLQGVQQDADVTGYVQGELACAAKDYPAAESAFAGVLQATQDETLRRRCTLSLAEVYRDCGDAIADANAKEIALLTQAQKNVALQSNPVLFEMLAAAEYQAGSYAQAAIDFQKVLSLGVSKAYLYTDVFTAQQAAGDDAGAAATLQQMEQAFPKDYTPHALMVFLLIRAEDAKPESARDYTAAYQEYQTAKNMVTSGDDTTMLQQIEGLMDQLRAGGWIS